MPAKKARGSNPSGKGKKPRRQPRKGTARKAGVRQAPTLKQKKTALSGSGSGVNKKPIGRGKKGGGKAGGKAGGKDPPGTMKKMQRRSSNGNVGSHRPAPKTVTRKTSLKRDPHAPYRPSPQLKKKKGPLTPAQKRQVRKQRRQEEQKVRLERLSKARKDYITHEQKVLKVKVPCHTLFLNAVAFMIFQLIGLAFRFLTLVFNIALLLAVLIKLHEDFFSARESELRQIFQDNVQLGIDWSTWFSSLSTFFQYFNITGGATGSPDLCAELLMTIWVLVPLLLCPFLFFMLTQDYLLRVAVVLGHKGETIDNFILAIAYGGFVKVMTDVIAKGVKFIVFLYAELFTGFWKVFVGAVEGVSGDSFANAKSLQNATVTSAQNVEFETCFPNDPQVSIFWIVICSLIFVLMSTPLLICVCLPGMFSNAQKYQVFDKRVVDGEDAPLPLSVGEFIGWSANVFGFAKRLYFNCFHPWDMLRSWLLMIGFFVDNVKGIFLLTFGVWNNDQAERFQVRRRAAKVDWNPVDSDNQQQRVMMLFGKQYGLFWFLVPGGALLSYLSEVVNDPPAAVFADSLSLKDTFTVRFIGWCTQIVAYVTLLLPCFWSTETGLFAAFLGVLPNWAYYAGVTFRDWNHQLKEDLLEVEEKERASTDPEYSAYHGYTSDMLSSDLEDSSLDDSDAR